MRQLISSVLGVMLNVRLELTGGHHAGYQRLLRQKNESQAYDKVVSFVHKNLL